MTKPPKLRRRDFLRHGLASATTVSLAGLGSMLPAGIAHAQGAPEYKALVFLFLAGGNDSYNMLVPVAGALRTRYDNGRGFIALPPSELHPITLAQPADVFGGTTHNDFGFHPSCSQIADIFNAGEMNVVCNTGNLITPVDLAQFEDETAPLPPQLFSHSDQQRQFQSEPTNPFRYGWGGRMAELLTSYNGDPLVSPLITLSGLNAFQVSRDSLVNPYGLSSDGALSLNSFNGRRRTMIENAMAAAAMGDDLLAQKYANVFESARTAEVIVRAAFEAAAGTGVDYDAIFAAAGGTDTTTQRRLKTVAKMIAGRSSMANYRPVFFIKMGGYDTHQNLLPDHEVLMADLDVSLKGFRDALVAQGDFDKVVTVVGSEFGRTFTPNGNNLAAGSDHGWGGHMLFMGSPVNGARLLGTHPDFRLNQGLDTGRGRWIPTTSTSQCTAELARWMDVPDTELLPMFPSLGNFSGIPAPAIIG